MSEIRIPVRNLAALLQSGSIDNRFGGKDRAQEGARFHRMLQKREGPGYQPEVSLSLKTEREGMTYLVHGRADGVLTRQDGVFIDEIKTTGYPLDLITEDFDQAHWGQAMCYAHFYCVKNGLQNIGVQLRYFQIETEEIKRFQRLYSAAELSGFYEALLDKYEIWAKLQRDWAEERDRSIRALPFPFSSYREGQRRMAAAVYHTVQKGGRLFCQAPTGIGKTMSTLFPSVKAMGEGLCERIFYLTAKTITRQSAGDALAHMRERGLRLKSVTLTAKDKICFMEERECNPEACPYANGYYDRLQDALYRLLQAQDVLTRDVIEEWARKETLCPFELSLELTCWCDAVICDYNYLFDPVVSLKRLFPEEGGSLVFLIDEAHNLVERSREMYSAGLSKEAVVSLWQKCRREKALAYPLGRVNSAFSLLRRRCRQQNGDCLIEQALPEKLVSALYLFTLACGEWLPAHRSHPLHKEVLDFYFEASFFLQIAGLYDEHYVTCLSRPDRGLAVKLLCLDTSRFLDDCMKRGQASILFSATLSPPGYFIDVLGGGKGALTCRLPSPFPPERCRLLVADRISTRYVHREQSLIPIAEQIFSFISGRRGNYMTYFPSYKYLRDVYETFIRRHPGIRTLIQSSRMSEAEREDFLSEFDEDGEESLLGFCVLGGIYSEGIDLRGERLIGTVIVGVGLPQINPETDALKRYYDERSGQGFDYSYRYPGMNKVLQAAGRVIRGMEDKGAVLLIDDRFTKPEYLSLFPPHWSDFRAVRSTRELEEDLRAFWEND